VTHVYLLWKTVDAGFHAGRYFGGSPRRSLVDVFESKEKADEERKRRMPKRTGRTYYTVTRRTVK